MTHWVGGGPGGSAYPVLTRKTKSDKSMLDRIRPTEEAEGLEEVNNWTWQRVSVR